MPCCRGFKLTGRFAGSVVPKEKHAKQDEAPSNIGYEICTPNTEHRLWNRIKVGAEGREGLCPEELHYRGRIPRL